MNRPNPKQIIEGLQRQQDKTRRKGLPEENLLVKGVNLDLRKFVKDGFLRFKVFKED